MLRARIATIAVILPAHLAVLIWGRPYHFLIYLEAVALIGLLEIFHMVEQTGRRPHRLAVILAGAAFLAAAAYRPAWAPAAAVALWAAVLVVPLGRRMTGGALADAGVSLVAFAYVPVLLGFLMLLRRRQAGVELLLIFFFTIWVIDIAAYTFGRLWGRAKLAPTISPGKTVVGAVAGLAAGLITPAVLARFLFPQVHWGWGAALAVGAVLACGDLAGDLAESALKRDAGVKDSGRLLPGHGGVLDRLDAALYCAPLYYGVVLWAGRAS